MNKEIKYLDFPIIGGRLEQITISVSDGTIAALLAPIIVKEIFSIICEINKEGTTVLLIEQNAAMALQAAHRAYIIRNGEIEIEGNAKEHLKDEKVKNAYLGG